jgi:signal transduction histidine kinase
MELSRLRDWLLPGGAEPDEGFQQELLSLSHRGMRILGGTEIVAALGALAGFIPWLASAALLVLGLATLGASRVAPVYPHCRMLSVFSSGLGAVIAAASIPFARSEDFALGIAAVFLLSAVFVPLVPAQSLAIGIACVAAGIFTNHRVFLVMMALAAIAITAILYAERRSNHQSYLRVLQASQEFRDLQSRVMLAENSATMVHMSVALAHELSSPIGAVSSGVDTLVLLATRQAEVTPSDQKRLATLQVDLGRSLQEPMARLKKIVNRIQRLTNLDEAAIQRTNLNDLIKEAVALVKPQTENDVHFELDLDPVPELSCRPQQLMAVFCNLLTNSMQAIEGQGRISVSTKVDHMRLEVTIEDDGRGISREKLAHIFDPAFQVAEGRVSTGNWSLFTSRQFIRDHGGEMRIQSREGRGTTVSLILPYPS